MPLRDTFYLFPRGRYLLPYHGFLWPPRKPFDCGFWGLSASSREDTDLILVQFVDGIVGVSDIAHRVVYVSRVYYEAFLDDTLELTDDLVRVLDFLLFAYDGEVVPSYAGFYIKILLQIFYIFILWAE